MSRFFDPSNPWPYVLFYVVTVLWVLEFVVFPSKFKSDSFSEKRSFRLILAGIVGTVLLNNVFTLFGWFTLEGALGVWLRRSGMVSYPLGLMLRYVSTFYLGQYFTRDVAINETQELISNGPYKVLRHPLYLGLFLLAVSVPLFFANGLILILSMLYMGALLNHRMRLEEANMERIMGERYVTWKKRRYRFIPFIY